MNGDRQSIRPCHGHASRRGGRGRKMDAVPPPPPLLPPPRAPPGLSPSFLGPPFVFLPLYPSFLPDPLPLPLLVLISSSSSPPSLSLASFSSHTPTLPSPSPILSLPASKTGSHRASGSATPGIGGLWRCFIHDAPLLAFSAAASVRRPALDESRPRLSGRRAVMSHDSEVQRVGRRRVQRHLRRP